MAHPPSDMPACDPGEVIALPRGHRAVALAAVAVFVLVGCSRTEDAAQTVPPPALLSTPTASPTPTPTGSSTPPPVDVELPESWAATPAADGSGYVLELESTGTSGVFDGRLYHRSADGGVTGQQVVTVTVTGPDAVDVRWPDATVTPGRLTLPGVGGARTELALDPGCLSYLVDGSSQLDCRLYPADEFGPSPSASAIPSPSASAQPSAAPVDLPDSDEALGYLCSISDPAMLDHVTDDLADPYVTAVLQGALVAVGIDPGPVDGRYRAKTRKAVRTFQESAGLVADGLVGPRTWSALQRAACTLPTDPAAQ